jgi:PadR family transcriptional regulator, regulatory protein PadR
MPKTSDRERKRGTLEMILLNFLSQRPMYGYELVATLESRGGELFQLKEGTLYPVLYRLEDACFVESRWATLERGVPRKYYSLTPAGVNELKRLVADWSDFVAAVNAVLSAKVDQEAVEP